jgi:hypothetical protein
MKIRNTNVALKKKMFNKFCDGLRFQFIYGGKKYSAINPLYPDKESTDYIVDCFPEFVESVMMKYLLRFKTQKREEDLFKIATYCYILWLKYYSPDVRDENIKIAKELRDEEKK